MQVILFCRSGVWVGTMSDRPVVADGPEVETDGIRVLLVDDDEAWAESTAQLLEHQRESMTVETAGTREAASSAYDRLNPDCVVCDYELESETGLELLAEVREHDPDRPFVLVTGRGDESVASDAIGRQVTDYFPKRSLGGRSDLLARRIEAAVETYRTRQLLARERRSKDAMLEILTATTARDSVTTSFCDHLAERYDCVWVGTHAQSTGVVPQAVAGAEAYVDRMLDPGDDPGESAEPALRTLADGDSHTAVPESSDADWAGVAREFGFERAVAVPLTHDGESFGVLAVYHRGPISEQQRTLLAEYGRTIGYALRSAAWRESLLSRGSVAVELAFTDDAVSLVSVARHLTDASPSLLTVVPREETLLYVLRVRATDEPTLDGLETLAGVESVRRTGARQGIRCELAVSRPTPETVVADRGGRVVETSLSGGDVSMTVAVPEDRDVRGLVETLEAEYPGTRLRSVRSTVPPTDGDRQNPLGALTDRQRQALELALYSGYFERPREHDASAVAERLGVSRQTFAQHLRAGQRNLLTRLLEGE